MWKKLSGLVITLVLMGAIQWNGWSWAMSEQERRAVVTLADVAALAARLADDLIRLQTIGNDSTREWARYAAYEATAIEQVAQEQLRHEGEELMISELTRHKARSRIVSLPESGATGE